MNKKGKTLVNSEKIKCLIKSVCRNQYSCIQD